MIARVLLIALGLVAGTGAGVAYLVGASWGAIVGWGLGAVVAFLAAIVCVTYAVARIGLRDIPAEFRVGPAAVSLAVLREFLAHIVVFSVLAPFEGFWTRRRAQPQSASAKPPVLLVHGYFLNAAAWWWFARLLTDEGYRVFTATIEPALGSIDAMAESLANRIESVCASTNSGKVHLVAHSMGGLVCRAYLRAHGPGRVARLITVATPHQGTVLARLGIGRCARQMAPGSAWLAALAGQETGMAHAPTVALFTYYDNYITPPESGTLAWARNEVLPAVGHVEMYFSRRVAAQVCRALDATAA